MAQKIPYDSSLVLGNILTKEKLDYLKEVSALQQPVEAAEETLISLMSTKTSLDMTISQLNNMGIDLGDDNDYKKELDDLSGQIKVAAINFAKEKMASEKAIQDKKNGSHKVGVDYSVESPIDYNKSEIKTMPLSSDSLNMSVQYFSYGKNQQGAATAATQISDFISAQSSFLGKKASMNIQSEISNQISKTRETHKLSGILVMSITCTHKNAAVFAPLILNPDKGIRAYNYINKDNPLDPTNSKDIIEISKASHGAGQDSENKIDILSGVTYGSCFIGLVNILNETNTETSENVSSIASQLQAQMNVGGWFSKASGGFGVDSSFSKAVKSLISQQTITSNCSLIVKGAIPSMKSNNVKLAVKTFSEFDGNSNMEKLAKLQNMNAAQSKTLGEQAQAARNGKEMLSLEGARIESVLSSVAEIDDGQNKIIDINSLMDAMDDYLQKVSQGGSGIPINYYIQPITKSQLAQMWVSKYYPEEGYLKISGDDSGDKK